MKKMLAILLLITTLNVPIYAFEKFKDVKENDWFKKTIINLSEGDIIAGYEDGTFRPMDKVKRDEYIKMVIRSLGYTDIENSSGYWATNYIEKAMKLKLIKEDEFTEYTKVINRGEMALIASRILEDGDDELNLNQYESSILDLNLVSSKYKEAVLKSYAKGILKGYEDGEFKCNNTLTRAEAATVIERIVEKDKRIKVSTKKEGLTFEQKLAIWEDEWIEPKFYDDREHPAYHYRIELENLNEYLINKEKDYMSYKVRVEVLNYKELNTIEMPSFVTGKWALRNLNEEKSIGSVFALRKKYYATREDKEKLILEKGMKIEHKVKVARTGNIDGKQVKKEKQYVLTYEIKE